MLHHSPKIPTTSPIIKQEQGNEAEMKQKSEGITPLSQIKLL